MKRKLFYELFRSRLFCIQTLFVNKNKQYGNTTDVFANNRKAAEIAGKQPEDFLMTQVTKHVALLCSRASALTNDNDKLTEVDMLAWRENMDDVSLWMYVLNGLLEERFQRGLTEDGI